MPWDCMDMVSFNIYHIIPQLLLLDIANIVLWSYYNNMIPVDLAIFIAIGNPKLL